MKILLSGAVILALWMGVGTYWYTCQVKGLCANSTASDSVSGSKAPLKKPPIPKPVKTAKWLILQDGQALFAFSDFPHLKQDAASVMLPDPATSFSDSIYNYLLAHPNKYVTITGKYTADEVYEGLFANLGEARADKIRQMLVEAGANPDRIRIAGQEENLSFDAGGNSSGGIAIELHTMNAKVEEVVDKGITNRTLYADFGAVKFQPDPTLASYAAEVKAYLEKHASALAHVTGHTDNVGSTATNMKFGRWRASKVRNYFVSQGIPSKRIKVDTKGMDAPIASNETEEGRAKNRRIEVHIK
ncbi:MAG TPA: hypothetical protein ENJ82_01980 [Bacteroidetes bacterium]|nr:hypothetical protein [Bacteroidota bacterium]